MWWSDIVILIFILLAISILFSSGKAVVQYCQIKSNMSTLADETCINKYKDL